MNIEPIGTNIIFKFTDRVEDGKFTTDRSSGIKVDLGTNYLEYGALCRRIKVYSVGPLCTHVHVGSEYIVENLKWTNGFVYENETYWMTREKHIVSGISQEIP